MEWGTALWNKVTETEKLNNQKSEYFEKLLDAIKGQCKSMGSYAKNLKKAPKFAAPVIKKKPDEFQAKNTFFDFAAQLQASFDEHSNQITAMLTSLNNLANEITKFLGTSANDRKTVTNNLSKATKEYQTRKAKCNSEKKTLIAQKNDVYKAMNQVKAAKDPNEITKLKAAVDKGKKNFEKLHKSYKKTSERYETTGTAYYNTVLPKALDDLQDLDRKRTAFMVDQLNGFFQIYCSTFPQVIDSFSNIAAKFHSEVNTNQDDEEFIKLFKSIDPRPKYIEYEEIVLCDDPSQDTNADNGAPRISRDMSGSAPSKASNLTEMVDLSTYSESEQVSFSKKRLEDLSTEKRAVMQQISATKKLKENSGTFGGDQSVISANLSEMEEELSRIDQAMQYYSGYSAPSNDMSQGGWGAANNAGWNQASQGGYGGAEAYDNQSYQQDYGYNNNNGESYYEKKVIYDFEATAEGEFPASAGEYLVVVEDDDGSGWTLVARNNDINNQGFIPTSYLE